MRCQSCGAPMNLVDGRSCFICPYCGALEFPHDAERSSDGFTPIGQEADLACPLCNMHLAVGLMEERRVLHCHRCRGVLVSNDDFLIIIRRRRARFDGPPDAPSPVNAEELKRKTLCPQCRRRMETHPYYGPGNAVLDTCARCKLIWFDGGEIGALERAPGPC